MIRRRTLNISYWTRILYCPKSGWNYSRTGQLKSTEIYYLDGQSELAGDLSEAKNNLLLVRVNNPTAKIYAVGGANGEAIFDTVEEWQHSTQTWRKTSFKLKHNRKHFGAVGVHGKTVCPQVWLNSKKLKMGQKTSKM